MTVPWHEQTATALGQKIRQQEINPVELTQHFLARIKTNDPDNRIYVRTTEKRALIEAEAAAYRAKQGRSMTRS